MVFVASVLNGTAAVEDRGINPSHSPLLGFPTPPFVTHRIREETMQQTMERSAKVGSHAKGRLRMRILVIK